MHVAALCARVAPPLLLSPTPQRHARLRHALSGGAAGAVSQGPGGVPLHSRRAGPGPAIPNLQSFAVFVPVPPVALPRVSLQSQELPAPCSTRMGHSASRARLGQEQIESGRGGLERRCVGSENRQTPPQQPAQPRHTNYWAPLTHKRHLPQPAQPRYTNDGAPQTRKQHQQEHRPQQPTKRSDLTQHAKGRMGDCPRPRKQTAT